MSDSPRTALFYSFSRKIDVSIDGAVIKTVTFSTALMYYKKLYF